MTATSVIASSNSGAVTYLTPSGTFTNEAVQALRDAIESCLAAGKATVVLDLHRVTLLGGNAIAAFLEANGRLAARGGRLQFAGASTVVKDVLIANRIVDAQ